MAQTGYTPILIYSSSTAANVPLAASLTNSTLGSELAINITDGKLFYKDNANAVQVIGWKVTPTTAGGTGLTSYTAGDMLYYATGTTLSKLGIGAANTVMTSSGSAPQWSTALTLSGNVTAASFIPSGSSAPTNGMYYPNTNTVAFACNSTRIETINSTGVGIKSTNPQSSLDLGDSTSGFALTWQGSGGAGGYGSVWTQYGAGNIWIGSGFVSNTSSNAFVSTISTASTYRSGISLDGASNNGIRFFTDGAATITKGSAYVPTQRMQIFSTGGVSIGNTTDPGAGALRVQNDVTFATGNLVQGTAAKGINFTANTPAAGMTSQLLNWYEEGTWTPVIAGATTPGTQTYSIQVGRYTRIGNRVFYNCRIVMTAKDAATSGTLYVGGLPFTSNNTASNFSPAAVSNAGNIDLTAGYTQISAEVQPNGTVVYLGQIGDNVAFSLLTDTALTNTTRIALSGNYEV